MRDLQEDDLQFGRDDLGPYLTRQREGRLGEEPANGAHNLQQREGQPKKLHAKGFLGSHWKFRAGSAGTHYWEHKNGTVIRSSKNW